MEPRLALTDMSTVIVGAIGVWSARNGIQLALNDVGTGRCSITFIPVQTDTIESTISGLTVGVGVTGVTGFVAIAGIGCAVFVSVYVVVADGANVTRIGHTVFVFIVVVVGFFAQVAAIRNVIEIVIQVVVKPRTDVILVGYTVAIVVHPIDDTLLASVVGIGGEVWR